VQADYRLAVLIRNYFFLFYFL